MINREELINKFKSHCSEEIVNLLNNPDELKLAEKFEEILISIQKFKEKEKFEYVISIIELFGYLYFRFRFVTESLSLYRLLYEEAINYQEKSKTHIHKGVALHQIGLNYLVLNKRKKAHRFFILAQIEDFLKDIENAHFSAYELLKKEFGWRDNHFKKLKNLVKSKNKLVLDPIEIYFDLLNEANNIKVSNQSFDVEFENKFLKRKFQKLKKNKHKYNKGDFLEKFVKFFLSCVDGWDVFSKKNNKQKGGDRDSIIRNQTSNPIVNAWGEYILVECKNTDKPVSFEQVSSFIGKLMRDHCRCGIIISNKGTSGKNKTNNKTNSKYLIDTTFVREDIIILELTFKEIENVLNNGEDLIEILINKYERVKFNLGED